MDISPNLPFSQAFDFASEAVAERFQNPFWKLKEFFVGSQLRGAMREVRQFGCSIVSLASLQRVKRGGVTATCQEKFIEDINGTASKPRTDSIPSPIKESENLINSLLDHIDDQQIVADAAMNYLSAGLLNSSFLLLSTFYFTISPPPPRPLPQSPTNYPLPSPRNTGRDTTAQSLTWTFYLLMRHPSTTTKILAELPLPSVPTPNTPNTTNTPLESLLPSSLPYTNAVFYESLRLYPPVPIEIKETSQRATLPDGTVLPSGAIVMYIPWAMNRCIEIWGETAHDFLPDRWLSSSSCASDDDPQHNHNQKKKEKIFFTNNKSAYEFPVFNAGPRTCLGKKFAEALAVAVLVALVPKYHFTLLPVPADAKGLDERKSRNGLTLPMDGGLPCLVRKRHI